mmetsp:Transcript_34831/g.52183  ORF Transcript_34831/g.52183 Transcript_34831/m.52183 type:complete len:84 (-) Transcript_34831:42-293(-)
MLWGSLELLLMDISSGNEKMNYLFSMSAFFCIYQSGRAVTTIFRAGNRQRNIRKISGAAFDVKLLRPTVCKESTSQHHKNSSR